MEKNEFRVMGSIRENDYELPDELQWELVYENNIVIQVEEMQEAVAILRKRQDEDDRKFEELALSLGIDLKKEYKDWWNYSPSYLMHFYYWDIELADWVLTTDNAY
ncbi:MAG: hypothetical protein CK427_17155 [Leptospira sp.]|nr:MAG: hypothetical protein CK427_17155 [Leptospira sp.]